MGWTITIEDEKGKQIKKMTKEFTLSETDLLYNGHFRLLKYLNPCGDMTFNSNMFADLIADLNDLKTKLPDDGEQIEEVINLTMECGNKVHSYLKFYGD